MDPVYTLSCIKRDTSYNELGNTHTIIQCLDEHRINRPNDEAFVFVLPSGGAERVTWSALWCKSLSTANGLSKLGVKRHDIVAVNVRCCSEWLYAAFGTMMLGAVPVAVSFTYVDGSDLIALMKKMERCSTLIMDPGKDHVNWNIIKELLDVLTAEGNVRSKHMPSLRILVGHAFGSSALDIKKFEDLMEENADDIQLPTLEPDDVAFMMQTSGSTGSPKLVVHTHGSIASPARTELLIVDNRYKIFNDRPFSWVGGFPWSVLTGMCRVTISGMYDPPADFDAFMFDVIVRERCAAVLAMPMLMAEFIRRQDDLPENWPVKVILTGGQPVSKNVVQCIGKACESICVMYASTEFMGATQDVITDPDSFTEHTSGTPLQLKGLEMKVVDNQGKIVPVNTRGELYVRSPAMFREYFNDPEKTSQILADDGWYRTDDMGQMNEKAEFIVGGRKSNMILSRGMTVAPEIMEVVIKKCPGVENAVVVPVPDDAAYQELCACVIIKPGSDVQEADLRAFCDKFHADKPRLFTVLPKYYMFCDKFPATTSGKVSRKCLEKSATSKFSP